MQFWKHFYRPTLGIALLRITLALLMLLHGWAKITQGIGSIEALLLKHQLPTWLAYGVFAGEVLAPLLLLIGLWVVPAALVVAVNMLVALALAHGGHWLQRSSSGGWALELQALLLVAALVVALCQPPHK